MISYRPLKRMLAEKKVSMNGIVSAIGINNQVAWKLRHNLNVNMVVIDRLCAHLGCQPSDLIEYLEDDDADI